MTEALIVDVTITLGRRGAVRLATFQAFKVRRVKIAPWPIAGLQELSGLASHSGALASSKKGATPTSQTEEPDQSIFTTLQCAEVLL